MPGACWLPPYPPGPCVHGEVACGRDGSPVCQVCLLGGPSAAEGRNTPAGKQPTPSTRDATKQSAPAPPMPTAFRVVDLVGQPGRSLGDWPRRTRHAGRDGSLLIAMPPVSRLFPTQRHATYRIRPLVMVQDTGMLRGLVAHSASLPWAVPGRFISGESRILPGHCAEGSHCAHSRQSPENQIRFDQRATCPRKPSLLS